MARTRATARKVLKGCDEDAKSERMAAEPEEVVERELMGGVRTRVERG